MKTAKRVAFNTVVQYIQLIVNVLVGLYSVRLILASLGTVDYGIYDLIAGIIALLGFVRSSLSQTSIRFVSVSLGARDTFEVRKVFSSCFWMHFLISIGLVCLMELAGLFLFNGYLNIPVDRVSTARHVYQFMILTVFLSVIITPFKALFIAHEKFVLIAIVGIIDSLLKLGIALLLTFTFGDKLLIYGLLMACITVFNFVLYALLAFVLYRQYVCFAFPLRGELRKVSSFASWTLLDVLGSLLSRQGYAIMLNKFFGPETNTVFALSRQVEGHLYTLSSSIVDSMKPQIMKSQGAGDVSRVFRISLTAGKFGFSMMALIAIPLLVLMPEVLNLWLKDVPEGTVLFSRLLIIACLISQLTHGLIYANQAIGNIKWFSIVVSSVRILALPISVLLLLSNAPAYSAIIVFVLFESIGSFSRIIILSRISTFKPIWFFKDVLLHVIPPLILSFVLCIFFHHLFNGLIGLIVSSVIAILVYTLVFYFFGLTAIERKSIWSVVKKEKFA